jgi:hypothetical protein
MNKKVKSRIIMSADEKLNKAVSALFILESLKLGVSNKEIRSIIGGDMRNVDFISKIVNKAIKNSKKQNI